MNSFYFVEANAIVLMLGIWLSVTVKKEGTLRASNQIFFRMTLCTTVMLVLEALCVSVNGRAGKFFYITNLALNAVRLIVALFAAQTWLLYGLHFLRPKKSLPKRLRHAIFLPFVTVSLLVLASVFTKWLFYVDRYTNLYTMGKFSIFHSLTTYTYFGCSAHFSLLKILKSSFKQDKMNFTYFMVFVLMPVVSGIVTFFYPYFNIVWILVLISLFVLFTRVQFSQIVKDGLTGVNNRNSFDNYICSLSSDRIFSACLFMMDINFFKGINDTYGHPEGDQALEQTAKIVSQIFKDENCMIARYGGDEFAVLFISPDQLRQLDVNAEAMRLALYKAFADYNSSSKKPYELTISVGYAFMIGRGEESASQLLKASDASLYQEKQRIHALANRYK